MNPALGWCWGRKIGVVRKKGLGGTTHADLNIEEREGITTITCPLTLCQETIGGRGRGRSVDRRALLWKPSLKEGSGLC